MEKLKHPWMKKTVAILENIIGNATIIYILILLAKFLYFNSQIGTGAISDFHLVVSLGALMILASISLLFRPASAALYMRVLDILLTFIIFSNIVFCRYFNDLISIPLLFQARNLSDVQSSLLQLLHWSDILLAVDFIAAAVLFKSKQISKHSRDGIALRIGKALVCCLIGIAIVWFGFGQLLQSQPTILQTFYDRVYVAQNIGLLNYHAADAYTFIQQSIEDENVLDDQKLQELLSFFEADKQKSKGNKQLSGIGKGKNLIVIQAEALQQFVMKRTINGQEITPNLNKLADTGIYFDNYYFQTAGGGTSDAEFTSLVSMLPMKEGAVYIRKPGNYYYSLPKKLKENGYTTLAMHGYKPGFWNRSVVYQNLGFDEFYSMSNMKQDELLGMGISDKSFFKQATEKLKQQQQPYFAFLISLSNHFPYENDKTQYSSFEVGEYKDTLMGNYLESVHYADEALGEFVSRMQAEGMLENSILVVYGDHHGIPKDNAKELAQFLGKGSFSPKEWLALQKVPMIISGLDASPTVVHTVGGDIDFMPTLLNIMGMNADNHPSLGRDLINAPQGLTVLRNGSFVSDNIMYISNENSGYEMSTGEIIEPDRYKDLKNQADKMLSYSDMILKFDLSEEIKNYLEKHVKQ